MKKLVAFYVTQIKPWMIHAFTDAKALFTGALTGIVSAVGQLLQTVPAEVAMAWTKRQWAFHALWTIGPALLTTIIMGRPHQNAEAIAGKLQTAGYTLTKP